MQLELTSGVVQAEAAWRLLADTDHLYRVGGLPPIERRVELDEHGFPALRGVLLGPAGLRHEYEEIEQRWEWGRSSRHTRCYQGSLFEETRLEASLEPEGDGVVARIRFELLPVNSLVGAGVAPAFRALRTSWKRELDRLPRPGVVASPPNQRELVPRAEGLLQAWLDRHREPALVVNLRRLLRTSPEWALQRIVPAALDPAGLLGEGELLEACLEAVALGMVRLVWMCSCRRCGAEVERAPALGALSGRVTCTWCRHTFAPSLDRDVHVVLGTTSAVVPHHADRFATLFPARRPDLVALTQLSPGQEDELHLELGPGKWTVGVGGELEDTVLMVGEGSKELSWSASTGPGPVALGQGPVRLRLRNEAHSRVRVVVQHGAMPRGVSAARLVTWPGYEPRLGPHVVGRDQRLRLDSVVLLFSELAGATALYRAVGDEPAFLLIQEHLERMAALTRRWRGLPVKTEGDAVLAIFLDPADATGAALEMLDQFTRMVTPDGLGRVAGLRVGCALGPTLLAQGHHGALDVFGATSSLACLAAVSAAPGELVLVGALAEVPAVVALIEDARQEPMEVRVRGEEAGVAALRLKP